MQEAEQQSQTDRPVSNSQQPAQVIALISGKGGAGKTAICGSLGFLLGELGLRVLMVDIDLATHGLTYFFTDEVRQGKDVLDITSLMRKSATLDFLVTESSGYEIQWQQEADYPLSDSLREEILGSPPQSPVHLERVDFIPSVAQIGGAALSLDEEIETEPEGVARKPSQQVLRMIKKTSARSVLSQTTMSTGGVLSCTAEALRITLHREGAAHPHHVPHHLRPVHQRLLGCASRDGGVDLVHLEIPHEWPLPPGLSGVQGVLLVTLLVLPAIGFAIGWVRGFPRWAYPYVVYMLLFNLYMMNVATPGLRLFGYTFGRRDLWGWRALIPCLVMVLVALAISRSLQPLRRFFTNIWNDWTLLTWALFGFLPHPQTPVAPPPPFLSLSPSVFSHLLPGPV